MAASAVPGMVMVWSADRPHRRVVRTPIVQVSEQALVLGRDLAPDDDRISHEHLRVYPRPEDFVLTDLRTRNGTFADGDHFKFQKVVRDRAVVRTGRTVWLALLDVTAVETTEHGADPLALDQLAFTIRDIVAELAPGLAIHASVIERGLLSAWRDRDELVAVLRAAIERCRAEQLGMLRAEHLGELRPRTPLIPFEQVFERILGAPPPFEIVRPYHVMIKGELGGAPTEQMIGTGGDPLLVQVEAGAKRQPGWFQAGFWGHGVNSYSVYYGRTTDRYHLFLRLPYGDGAYCQNPARERAWALEMIAKYARLVNELPVDHAVLIESMGAAHYELSRAGKPVLSNEGDLFSLNEIDLLDLLAKN